MLKKSAKQKHFFFFFASVSEPATFAVNSEKADRQNDGKRRRREKKREKEVETVSLHSLALAFGTIRTLTYLTRLMEWRKERRRPQRINQRHLRPTTTMDGWIGWIQCSRRLHRRSSNDSNFSPKLVSVLQLEYPHFSPAAWLTKFLYKLLHLSETNACSP